ncbi:hypothetical protein KKB44_06590 [Candidatus Micrarchaeota archaeon]|nr:hypothetical protein [Candidatus Micrarchaeota archaeon]
MALNIKNILRSSLLIIIIGLVLVISSLILRLLPVVLTTLDVNLLSTISMTYSFILFAIFFLLYFWAGIRAVKSYRLDTVGAGLVSAFSFFVTGIFHLLLETVLGLLFASHVIAGTFVSGGATIATAVFGDAAIGGVGIGLASVCGLGILALGTLMNFAIGGFGALFEQR